MAKHTTPRLIASRDDLDTNLLVARSSLVLDPSDSGTCSGILTCKSTIMAQKNLCGKLPPNAASDIEAYTLQIPDSDIKHMQDLLKLTPVADPIYENSLPDGDRRWGVRRDWLVEAKRVWETDFDWQVSRPSRIRCLILLQEKDRRTL